MKIIFSNIISEGAEGVNGSVFWYFGSQKRYAIALPLDVILMQTYSPGRQQIKCLFVNIQLLIKNYCKISLRSVQQDHFM